MKKIVLSCAVVLALVASSCKNNQAEQAAAAVEQAAVAVEQTAAGIATSGSYAVEPSSVIEWVGKKPTGQRYYLSTKWCPKCE